MTLIVTKDELLDLFQLSAIDNGSWSACRGRSRGWFFKSPVCVQLVSDSYSDLTMRVLHQLLPVSQHTKWKNPDKDLQIKLSANDDDTYNVSSAVAFRHGYYEVMNPDCVRLIFNTATECVKDVIERDRSSYQKDRFTGLVDGLKKIEKERDAYHQYPS